MNLYKYFVVGLPSAKSASPVIYNHLFSMFNINAYYSRLSLQDIKHIRRIIEMLDIKGFNITMPYKQSFFNISDISDEYSVKTEATNTIKVAEKYYGYNTDFIGFNHTLLQYNCEISRKRILLIGAGNTAGTVLRALDGYELDITLLNRSSLNSEIIKAHFNRINLIDSNNLEQLLQHYDIIINTVPNVDLFKEYLSKISCDVLIDFNYISNNLKSIISNYNLLIDGYHLLINQALYAFEIFFNQKYSLVSTENNELHQELYELLFNESCKAKNIVFNGFMGAGKSSIARAIAEQLKMEFIDIDSEIESAENMSIQKIFDTKGEEYFRNCESEFLNKLQNANNAIISTGAGILEREENLKLCKSIGYNVFLISDFDVMMQRIDNTARPKYNTLNHDELEQLFNNRLNNYYLSSDLIYYNNGKIEDSISHLISEFKAI